jgi:hypothetical protein
MDTARPMCGSRRMLGGLKIECNRQFAHLQGTKHRAILDDLTVVVWDGEDSRGITPRFEEEEKRLMSSLETRLTLLATRYGRFPVYEDDGRVGFGGREQPPEEFYITIEEALKVEARHIRDVMCQEQDQIRALQHSINSRLTHLGILDD